MNPRLAYTNDIRAHPIEVDEGPPVVLLRGFPEGWSSWRHQLRALAAARYHAVAPGQRGAGRCGRPDPVAAHGPCGLAAIKRGDGP